MKVKEKKQDRVEGHTTPSEPVLKSELSISLSGRVPNSKRTQSIKPN